MSCSEGTCGGVGAICASGFDCTYGNCQTGTRRICGGSQYSTVPGSSCTANTQCVSRYCYRNECLSCSRNNQCASGSCQNGVCR